MAHPNVYAEPETMYNAPSRDQLERAIDALVIAHRVRCLWFAPPDYLPQTDAARLRALAYFERRGDRKAFIRARELKDWLLQISSGL